MGNIARRWPLFSMTWAANLSRQSCQDIVVREKSTYIEEGRGRREKQRERQGENQRRREKENKKDTQREREIAKKKASKIKKHRVGESAGQA